MTRAERDAAVRAGTLCYCCQKREPTHQDEFGGMECDECEAALLRMRWLYALNPERARQGKKEPQRLRADVL